MWSQGRTGSRTPRGAWRQHAQRRTAASLREGLDETLTVQALGITSALYRTLRTTNPIENLNGSIAHYTRNVKRWREGQMTALGRQRPRRRKGPLPQAARSPRHEAIDGRVGQAHRHYPIRRTEGRVASRTRSRHTASFNSERDIAISPCSLMLAITIRSSGLSCLYVVRCSSIAAPYTG